MAAELRHMLTGPRDAPVLVLGNSLGTNLSMWDSVVPALRERFRVLRFDNRGHGGSAVPPGPYAIADLGRDALAMLDGLGFERVHYCGLSIGGMIGMWLAANAPDRIDRLALCCTSAWLPPAEGWRDRAARVLDGGTAAVAGAVLARWFTRGWAAGHPEQVERARAMLVGTPRDGYAACCEAIAAMDLRDALPSITAHTLVVSAGNDLATPPEHGEAIAKAVPDARFALLPGPAHIAAIEEPDALAALLLEHFTR